MYSVFQSIFSTSGGPPALLRVRDNANRSISPKDAFRIPDHAKKIIHFDQLCRMVHVVNCVTRSTRFEGLPYLNVNA